MSTEYYFSEQAFLPTGWANKVRIQVTDGRISQIETDAEDTGCIRLSGPTLPTMPNLHSHAFQRAMAGGITAMQILPGSANLVGGRGYVIHNVPTRGSRAMRFPGAPETVKMACGENPKRVYGGKGGAPSTRMGNLRGQRAAYARAREYAAEWSRWADKHEHQVRRYEEQQAKLERKGRVGKDGPPKPPDDPPARDLDLETLVGVLEGRVLPQIHCYRADDMLAMMQLGEEFGFQIRSFHHALEAYKIRDLLARHDIASSTWADWWGFKLEAYDGIPANAALLTQAGARAIIHSDSAIGIQRLNQEAAKAWASGTRAGIELERDQVLKWVTLHPAWALGIDDQVGSLEPGKRADVVVWTADPFSVYAEARWVFVDGALMYDKDRPRTWSDFEVGQGVTP